jgi:hypothetical protein
MTRMLNDDIEERLARRITEGNYQSFDEVLAAFNGEITDTRILEQVRTIWLTNAVAKGDVSGGEIPAEDVFGEARARIESTR